MVMGQGYKPVHLKVNRHTHTSKMSMMKNKNPCLVGLQFLWGSSKKKI